MPVWSVWAIGALVVIADRLSKLAVMKYMTEMESIPVIPKVLFLTYVHNTGAAFGMFQRGTLVLAGISALVVVLVVWAIRLPVGRPTWFRVALGLILGGALGNLYDRLFYRAVVDFLDVRVWPVFNVADSGIFVGGILAFFVILFDPVLSSKEAPARTSERTPGGEEKGGEAR